MAAPSHRPAHPKPPAEPVVEGGRTGAGMQTHPNCAGAPEQCLCGWIGRLPADMVCANDAEASVCGLSKTASDPGVRCANTAPAPFASFDVQGRMTPFRNFRPALASIPHYTLLIRLKVRRIRRTASTRD